MEVSNETLRKAILEVLAEVGSALENSDGTPRGASMVSEDGEYTFDKVRNMLSLPGVLYDKDPSVNDDARAMVYLQIPYKILADRLTEMIEATNTATEAAGNVDEAITAATEAAGKAERQGDAAEAKGNTAKSQGDTAESQGNTAEAKGNAAETKGNTAEQQGNTAKGHGDYAKEQGDYAKEQGDLVAEATEQAGADHERAESDHQAAVTATDGAENVNAQLDGMTVIITDRHGQSRSVGMAFDIYDSYKSIAEMNAHLAEIPNGGLASIATDDPTDPDNAKLYQKRSDGTLAYIGDLDQASAAAWADWLENHKQQIADATDAANTAAENADEKASLANTIYNTVRSWFNGTDNDGFKSESEQWLSDTKDEWTTIKQARDADWSDYKDGKDTDWTAWVAARLFEWNAWWQARRDEWTAWFSDTLADGVRRKWNDFWQTVNGQWYGTENTDGLKKEVEEARDNANGKAAYAGEQGDRAKLWCDNPPRVNPSTNYWQYYNPETERYEDTTVYAKGDNLNWDDIPDAERERLISEMIHTLEESGFDETPTENSTKPVRSAGVKSYVDKESTRAQDAEGKLSERISSTYTKTETDTLLNGKQDTLEFASVADSESIVGELI